MIGVGLPVTRRAGRGLLVGSPAARADAAATLRRLGCPCVEIDDPYAAMAELASQPTAYSSLVLSLNTMFGEELAVISVVKRRFAHIEIWLTRFEGLQGLLDEAMRLGADGYLDDDGLHRLPSAAQPQPAKAEESPAVDDRPPTDPILTAEELRALLDDPPSKSS
jgi:hypothetical protein